MKEKLITRKLTEEEEKVIKKVTQFKKGRKLYDCPIHGMNFHTVQKRTEMCCSEGYYCRIPERRGKSKKPRRSGRKAVKDLNMIDPKNRPTEEEMDNSGVVSGNLEKLCYQTIDWIKSGVSLDSCKELLSQQINHRTKKPYHIRFINTVVDQANRVIKESFNIQRKELVGLHTKRYDQDIQTLLYVKTDHLLPYKGKEVKIESYMRCLDVLQQKETLLGIHRKSFKLIINNDQTTIIKEKKTKIDLDKLSFEEQVELNSLIEKMKRSENEVSSIILKGDLNKVVEDIEHEMVEERKNIDRMENRDPKPLPEPQDNMKLKKVEEKLRLTLLEVAKKEFKRVGSKTIDNEQVK